MLEKWRLERQAVSISQLKKDVFKEYLISSVKGYMEKMDITMQIRLEANKFARVAYLHDINNVCYFLSQQQTSGFPAYRGFFR